MSEKLVVGTDELLRGIASRLAEDYDQLEAQSLAAYLLEGLFDVGSRDVTGKKTIELSEVQKQKLEAAISRLKNHEPVQHILGYGWFYGRKFAVNSDVLVPRPETEELVHWLTKSHGSAGSRNLLDIGTGTGCIPITIALETLTIACEGWDISEKALAVARENASQLEAKVGFKKVDILRETIPEDMFDIIVSNPPYVRASEKALMDRNVLEYDPELALFVPDDSPLLFYERISSLAIKALRQGGWLYFEINEAFGGEMESLLKGFGFEAVELKKDLNGRDRMIRGRRPESQRLSH